MPDTVAPIRRPLRALGPKRNPKIIGVSVATMAIPALKYLWISLFAFLIEESSNAEKAYGNIAPRSIPENSIGSIILTVNKLFFTINAPIIEIDIMQYELMVTPLTNESAPTL